MLHSEYSRKAKDAIVFVQSSVRYRGTNTAAGWIRNPLEVTEKFATRLHSKYLGAQRSADPPPGGWSHAQTVNQFDRLATDSQTGNCGELSAVAYNYLKRQGVVPLEYFAVYRGSWNHAFVLLNRDRSVPIDDFKTWSYQAVVCDPLYDRSDDACHLLRWYSRMFPLVDSDVFLSA